MFWTYNTTSPQIDIILCKEDLTLHELLDQDNVLQELKAQNLKLIEFLIKPDILRELVSLIITEPSPDSDLSEQYRYPNLACELLTSDLPALNERLASEEILNKLYQFLRNEPPLNPLLSSYFSRTLSILISRKSEQNWFSYQYTCLQALEFFKAKEEFIQLLLKHMGTSSIMDLMLNLITLIEGPELKQSLWNWLQSQDVIPSLISLLGPHSNLDCQTNAASLLSSIIQKLRENLVELNDKSVLDPVLHLLESAKVMELLLNTVFNADVVCDTSIQNGVDVLLVLLQPYLPGDARCRLTLNYSVHDKLDSGLVIPNNNNNNKINNNNCNSTNGHNKRNNFTINLEDFNKGLFVPSSGMITVILPFIEKFKNILMNPLKKEPIQLTSGIISPPFGKARLLVTKLIGALISLNSNEINEEIKRCDILELLLDLFYAYTSNNFLHTEVEKVIAYVIDLVNENDVFAVHLLEKCKLIERILDIWQENLERENEGYSRRGYMGHVIRIATLIHNEMRRNSIFEELVTEATSPEVLTRWNTFISDDLTAIIEKHSTCLGGIRPKLCQSSDNSFEESVSSKDLRSELKDFGQEDDQNMMFTNDSSMMDYGEEGFRFSNGLTEEEEVSLEQQTKMFDLMCKQRWQSYTKGLDNLEENDEDNESNQRFGWGEVHWGSDEEDTEGDTQNVSNPWSKLGNVSDPWANSTSNEESDDSWNSSDASNWAKFDENFSETFSSNSTGSGEALSGTCPELNATIDQYELFSGGSSDSTFQSMDILNTFSNVKITSGALDPIESSTPSKNSAELGNEGKWVLVSNGGENVDESKNYDAMQGKYNCFHQRNKDGTDEMLNLASICGNTLAEKIANAENDIRNQDEEELQQHHQRPQNERLANSFGEENEQTSCNSSECDIDIRVNCDEMLEEERLREQNALFLSPLDCLTENSYDFFTAENSTSDAESSTEFGDAENSLELEEEDSMTEQADLSPSNELSESSIERDTGDGRESLAVDHDFVGGNVSDQNRVQMLDDILNNEEKQKTEDVIRTEMDASENEENNAKINSKLYNSMNGVDEHSTLKDHAVMADEVKEETFNGDNCDPSKDRADDQADVCIVTDEPV